MDFSRFRENLTALVESRGITFVELGAATNMASTTLHRYISGDRTPDLPNLMRLAEYFDVSLDWLLGFSDERFECIPAEMRQFMELYNIASPDDRRVIQAVLSKYRKEK